MKSHCAVALVAASVSLSACTVTVPVRGQMEDGDETFSGTATGYADRSGNLKIVSSKGLVCEGIFVYANQRQGEGVFNCSDGRSGPFTFISTGSRGTGSGRLGDQFFTFTFG